MKTLRKIKPHSQPLPEREFCYRHINNSILWTEISERHDLSIDFVREFRDKINWETICNNGNFAFTWEFLDEFEDRIDWYVISDSKVLEHKDLIKYKDKLNWSSITRNQKLTEEELYQFSDLLNWNFIYNQNLTDKFIRDYYKELYPSSLARFCKLSEQFIEEHIEDFKPLFSWISRCQKLSAKFIYKYIDWIDIGGIVENSKISTSIRNKFKTLVDDGIIESWGERYWDYVKHGVGDMSTEQHNLSNPEIVKRLGVEVN